MAQIRYQQGKTEEAKEYFARAAAWRAKHRPTDAELIEHLARTQAVLQLEP
jgi:TolA-binding protein